VKNITITVDATAAAWARRAAGRQGKSVSRFIGELLTEHMEREAGYQAAMRRFFADSPVQFDADCPRPTRESLHERAGLR
jgi:hypothetical protein